MTNKMTGYREAILVELDGLDDEGKRADIIDNVDREGQWRDREQWPNSKHVKRINRVFGVAAEFAFARAFASYGALFRMPDGPDPGWDGELYCRNADTSLKYDAKWRRSPGGGVLLNTREALKADLAVVLTWSSGQIGRYEMMEQSGRIHQVVDDLFFWRFFIKRWCTRSQFRDDGLLKTVRKGKPDERDRWILEQRDMNHICDLSVMLDTVNAVDCARIKSA